MSSMHAVIIGTAPRPRFPQGERRPVSAEASLNARTPIPRRIPHEFYPTPPEAVRALLSVETFDGTIWEPACGGGAVAKVLTAAGHTVVSTDLYGYGFGQSGVNFLAEPKPRAVHIITNPPYGHGLANLFIDKALIFAAQTGGKTAMFLNLASLSHPIRTKSWKKNPPARLCAVDDIVCWPDKVYGPAPEAFKRHRYFWAVWHPGHAGAPQFWWVSGKEFR